MLTELVLISLLASLISAIPKIGIQRDYYAGDVNSDTEPRLLSYSAEIGFDDKTIPGDKTKMSDAQFINLARRAYDEMVTYWAGKQWPENLLPGSMIAMESQGSIYFASAVRKLDQSIDINLPNKDVVNSASWFYTQCEEAFGPHRNGGACAEPNVLRFYATQNPDDQDKESTPPKSNKSPRVAVWGRKTGDLPRQNKETYFPPCGDINTGWGCNRFSNWFGFKPVSKQDPDPAGEDDWKFSRDPNFRNGCSAS